ncbi:hypothetical protein [Bartonella gliris]|uniref:hypothetical protein n=1 Tax=Bartonella gliris TaxID=3004109 RepID=UPI003873A8CF
MKYTKTQLALVLAPIALSTLTIFLVPYLLSPYLLSPYLLSFVTNELQTQQLSRYLHSEPLLVLVAVASVSLFYTLSQKLHLCKGITLVSAIFFGIAALYHIGDEIKRLNPSVGQQEITWNDALKFMDPMVIFGTIIGVALLAIQSITTSPRASKIKHVKKEFLMMLHGYL